MNPQTFPFRRLETSIQAADHQRCELSNVVLRSIDAGTASRTLATSLFGVFGKIVLPDARFSW